MNADTTSVPPLIDATWTCSPTWSRNHSDDAGGSDDPVIPTVRSADRSWSFRGVAPAFMHAQHIAGAGAEHRRPDAGGDLPQRVRPRSRRAAVVADDRRARPAARDLKVPHHPAGAGEPEEGVVAPDVDCRATALRCSSTTPPWPCTMPLGRPVVPDENRIHSGWSKGTARRSRVRDRCRAARSSTKRGPQRRQPRTAAQRRRRACPGTCRRTGTRRRSPAPWARVAPVGPALPWPNSPDRRRSRRRRCSPWPGTRSPPRGCWADSRRPDHRGRRLRARRASANAAVRPSSSSHDTSRSGPPSLTSMIAGRSGRALRTIWST